MRPPPVKTSFLQPTSSSRLRLKVCCQLFCSYLSPPAIYFHHETGFLRPASGSRSAPIGLLSAVLFLPVTFAIPHHEATPLSKPVSGDQPVAAVQRLQVSCSVLPDR
jgi:hypothetical protein